MDTQQFEVIRPKCAGLDVHKKSVVAAVKSKKEPYFAIKYQRITKRRGKKKAIYDTVSSETTTEEIPQRTFH